MKTQLATTIEQSKELLRLGLSVDTADMRYLNYNNGITNITMLYVGYNKVYDVSHTTIYPAWSLTALLNLIPNYQLQTIDGGKVSIIFGHKADLHIIENDTPINACYDLITWLLENKYL